MPGGNGGGRITLVIAGGITNDGRIVADGQSGSGWNSGGGSGGSIKIAADALHGAGTIEADGGGNEVGGGGGRIAVYVNTLSFPTNHATAAGGTGFAPGGAGTVFFGFPPAPPGMPPSLPLITGFTFVPPPLPPPPSGPTPPNLPALQWTVPADATGGVYKLQFSSSLAIWTTIEEVAPPSWTGALPAGVERGFLRILRED